MNLESRVSRTIAGCGIIGILTIYASLLAYTDGTAEGVRWQHHAAHASIEMIGALASVWCARVLFWLEGRKLGTGFNGALSAALLCTGILRAFHAISDAGGKLIWLDSAATLFCGVMYALVWLNRPWMARRSWITAVAAFSTLLGVGAWSWSIFSPNAPMDLDVARQAVWMNVGGGLLILVASVRLLLSHVKTGRDDDLFFVIHCLFLGLASVAIDKSSAWEMAWWEWHLLRLSAFAVGVFYGLRRNPTRYAAEAFDALHDANHRLDASRAIYRSLIDQSENLIGLLSLDGRVLDVNDTALLHGGMAEGEILGRYVWETPLCSQSIETESRVRLAVERAAAGVDDHFDVTIKGQDGSVVYLNAFFKTVKDETGKPIYIIPEGRDVSVCKQREDDLEQSLRKLDHAYSKLETVNGALREKEKQALEASRAKSDFLANMSHEIRTPMTAILGYAELLLHDDELEQSGERRREAAQAIHRNGEHLLRLINDVLDLSKVEAGKLMIERLPCSPAKIIGEAIELMRVRAAAKGIALDVHYETAIPDSIPSDPTRLRQILVNLIGNAIKFTEFGGVRMVVRYCDKQSPTLECDVVDTGIGLTSSQVEHIFQPFMQADTSTTRRFGGSGLGLAISRRLAEDLGGRIEVVQSVLNAGSTFRLWLAVPIGDHTPMVCPNSSIAEQSGGAGTSNVGDRALLHGCRILFAEDGPDNQRFIAFVLRKAGAHVTIVDNGQAAIDSALAEARSGNPFHVILMDMQMPIMDGYAATATLRQTGWSGPIIALTAHAMQEDRERCLAAGCDDYESKPVQRQQLITKVASYYTRTSQPTNPAPILPVGHLYEEGIADVIKCENTNAFIH